ncbi:hypothetical protein [Nesterenkonia muleiensis]|uniref:hypothetical protein n=1 Tax=Nesterenkonia muleiensis TaxID=2282648 RepID=UPI000E714E40|nr:hypothetical protein [Nesterenkonia muleiensis]
MTTSLHTSRSTPDRPSNATELHELLGNAVYAIEQVVCEAYLFKPDRTGEHVMDIETMRLTRTHMLNKAEQAVELLEKAEQMELEAYKNL